MMQEAIAAIDATRYAPATGRRLIAKPPRSGGKRRAIASLVPAPTVSAMRACADASTPALGLAMAGRFLLPFLSLIMA